MNHLSSLTPPEPGTLGFSLAEDSDTSNTLSLGRQLLNLLRSLEKSLKHGLNKNGDEWIRILLLLTYMRDLFNRKGLFQGNTSNIDALSQQPSSSTASNVSDDVKHPSLNGNKRKRRQGASGGQYQVQLSAALDATNAKDGDNGLLNASSSCDEILTMTAISRIVNPSTSAGNDSPEFSFPWVLTRAAIDVLTAICYGTKDWTHKADSPENPCQMVECQILESFSSNLFNGLIKTAKTLIGLIPKGFDDTSASSDEQQEIFTTLSSCFTCFTWMIITLGTKVSRSTNIIIQIKTLVNDLLWIDRLYIDPFSIHSSHTHSFLNSLCGLVSVLPVIGDSNSTPHSKIWTHYISSIATSFHILIHRFFPDSSRKQETTAAPVITLNQQASIPFEKTLLEWIALVPHQLPSQQERIAAFSHRAHVYACILIKFLSFELYDAKAMAHFSTASLPIPQLLDLCDLLLGFSSHAERRYLNTKVRLRDVTIENGLFSVQSAVSIGSGMSKLGFDLFQTVISIMNQSSIIYGKRLFQSALVSLKSSTSMRVRKIVDPLYSDAVLNLGKSDKGHHGKMKWLHTSIVIRSEAIRTVSCVVEQIGSNLVFESNALVLVTNIIAGSLLEQILRPERVDDEHDWGTLTERVDLVTCCLHAMSSITSVCGAFMPFTLRETIESIALSCITQLRYDQNIPLLLSYASPKIALLELSLCCISTPWSDGCASSIIGTLQAVACTMRHDGDESVSSTAYNALAVCNALMTPRAPPLVLGVRNLTHDGDYKLQRGIDSFIATVSYDSLISGIMGDMTKVKDSPLSKDVDNHSHNDGEKTNNWIVLGTEKEVGQMATVDKKMIDASSKLNPVDDQGTKVTAAVDGSINPSSDANDAGKGNAFVGSLQSVFPEQELKLKESNWKSEKLNKFEKSWTRSEDLKGSASYDNDDEEVPDIVDGDPEI